MTFAKIRRFIDDTDGAAMVEAGIVLPVFLLVSFGAMLWALTLWQQITVQHAVEMETRCAILPGIVKNIANPYCGYLQCSTASQCAVDQAFGLGGSTTNFPSPTLPTNGGSFCAATSDYTNKFAISLIPQLPRTLSASYCRYSQ